ncbi:hypothetical protein [Blattabacterium cuenoti]|uniref:hypothetical protein n=1 Tax=Blattabacterium cuenoti TaxID=1653831 RepID=UPI001EEB473C|nr:hypothetical protein [Blattabacterium cuenoti]
MRSSFLENKKYLVSSKNRIYIIFYYKSSILPKYENINNSVKKIFKEIKNLLN